MVTRSLCLFLLVCSLIQINDATPSIMVIAEYIPKFISLSVKVAKIVGNETKQIFDTENNIRKLVDSAQATVDEQLANLDEYVAQSKAKASQSGANISSCLIEEDQGIRHIHLDILEKCRLQDGVRHLYVLSLKFAKEEVSISISVQWCIIKNPIDGSTLKTCFDDKINDVEDKIVEFQNEIDETLPEVVEYSNSCTARYLEALNMAIDKVYCNFKNCTDKIIT